MKKTFIFITLFGIWTIAMIDAKNFIEEREIASSRTPSQIEIRQPLNRNNDVRMNKPEYEGNSPYTPNAHERLRLNDRNNMQNNIDNMNNTKDKRKNY